MDWLLRWQPQLHAILRIVTGLLFMEHARRNSCPSRPANMPEWASR